MRGIIPLSLALTSIAAAAGFFAAFPLSADDATASTEHQAQSTEIVHDTQAGLFCKKGFRMCGG